MEISKKMKRKSEILKYLSDEDKIIFLSELLEAVSLSKKQGSFSAIDECLNAWEATAEIASIPGISEKVWLKFDKLKAAGILHG